MPFRVVYWLMCLHSFTEQLLCRGEASYRAVVWWFCPVFVPLAFPISIDRWSLNASSNSRRGLCRVPLWSPDSLLDVCFVMSTASCSLSCPGWISRSTLFCRDHRIQPAGLLAAPVYLEEQTRWWESSASHKMSLGRTDPSPLPPFLYSVHLLRFQGALQVVGPSNQREEQSRTIQTESWHTAAYRNVSEHAKTTETVSFLIN